MMDPGSPGPDGGGEELQLDVPARSGGVSPAMTSIDQHRAVAVDNAVEAFGNLLSPATNVLAQTRREQQDLLCTVREAKQRSDTLEERISAVEPTFAKLPLYIAKLELMGRNMKTLQENTTKTKVLAKKLQDEVAKLVSQ